MARPILGMVIVPPNSCLPLGSPGITFAGLPNCGSWWCETDRKHMPRILTRRTSRSQAVNSHCFPGAVSSPISHVNGAAPADIAHLRDSAAQNSSTLLQIPLRSADNRSKIVIAYLWEQHAGPRARPISRTKDPRSGDSGTV
jgi:hypothetical protein